MPGPFPQRTHLYCEDISNSGNCVAVSLEGPAEPELPSCLDTAIRELLVAQLPYEECP